MSQPNSHFSALHTLSALSPALETLTSSTSTSARPFRLLRLLRDDAPVPHLEVLSLSRTFSVGKLEYLTLARLAMSVLDAPSPGTVWTLDGYRSDTLYLCPLSDQTCSHRREVTFDLVFHPGITVMSVTSADPEVLGLYKALVHALERLRPARPQPQWSWLR